MLGLAVYFAQTALQHAQQVSAINQELANEISDRKRTEEELQRQNLRSQLFAEVTLKIRQSCRSKKFSKPPSQKCKGFSDGPSLNLSARWIRKVVQEAVVPGWPVILGRATLILAFNKGMWSGIARDGLVLLPTWRRLTSNLPCGISTAFCSEGQPCGPIP